MEYAFDVKHHRKILKPKNPSKYATNQSISSPQENANYRARVALNKVLDGLFSLETKKKLKERK